MSMLTALVDRLREAAELYDHMVEPMTSALLREAAETIASQQAHIDRLLALNGELCAEVNAKAVRIRELESLVRDVYGAWCFECNPWADDFACAWFDGDECGIRRRMTDLGLEVDA